MIPHRLLAAVTDPTPVPLSLENTTQVHLLMLIAGLAGGLTAVAAILAVVVHAIRRGDRILAAEAAVNGSPEAPGLIATAATHDVAIATLTATVADVRTDLAPIIAAWPNVEAALLELSPNSGSTWRDEYARDRDFIATSLFTLAGALGVALPQQPPASPGYRPPDH